MKDFNGMSKKALYSGRKGEKIGGGFFVFRRGKKTGRVGVTSSLPYEHPSLSSAVAEAERLSQANPGEIYQILGPMGQTFTTPEN
jgi:hypothetical protein